MRIVLTTFGSLGDLHPFLAIGLELARRGHGVTIAANAVYREKVISASPGSKKLSFAPVRPDLPPPDKMQPVIRTF